MKMISAVRSMSVAAVLLVPAVLTADPPLPSKPHYPSRSSDGNFRRRPNKAFFSKLTEAERAQIDQLARAGKKEELRKVMKDLFFKYRPEEMKQLDTLSERYLKSSDEKERTVIRLEMEKLARQIFRKRQDFTRSNIAEAEKQLRRAQKDLQRPKEHYQRNEDNMEKIIASHVSRMCLPPEQRKPIGRRVRPPRPAGPPAPVRSK